MLAGCVIDQRAEGKAHEQTDAERIQGRHNDREAKARIDQGKQSESLQYRQPGQGGWEINDLCSQGIQEQNKEGLEKNAPDP